ncbi:hypothetical protein ACFYVL_17350 [Streptomyces sp. NPDC004111]|uniref:hypothetical protein n=1 Tax=Streptomyces sp. NPDC004111 TaxID=3364690 RepID=UPI0036AF5513
MTTNFGIEIRKLLAQVSGFDISDTDYVAYFVNDTGERLIFVQARGQASALHSDLGWEPQSVDGPTTTMADSVPAELKEKAVKAGLNNGMLDTPMLGSTILGKVEAQWLNACYAASEPLRQAG